ncbi:hypothetical protein ACLB2K_017581 [Fragaria x ananassa]
MGWTSTGDPYANVGDAGLSFDSEQAAKEFAEKHGWDYTLWDTLLRAQFLTAVQVRMRHTPLLRVRTYADNFKWKGLPKSEEK